MADGYKVWLDQELCTGDGICQEICPKIFHGMDDGLYYVKDPKNKTGLNPDGTPTHRGSDCVDIPEELLNDVIEAAEECPGLCIFVEKNE